MNGVYAIRYLLAHNVSLTASVPSSKIFYGSVDLDVSPPFILLTQVSGFERPTVAMSETPRFMTERVQLTAFSDTYLAMKEILALARVALPLSRGTVDGIAVDSIVPDSEGPDIVDPSLPLYSQSQDYIVRLNT